MKLQLKISDDGIIEDAKFKTFGCGSAIASSSLATEWVKGMTVDQAMAIKNTQIVEELNLPPVKIHCSVLAEDAIKGAIADYKAKRARARGQGRERRRKRTLTGRRQGPSNQRTCHGHRSHRAGGRRDQEGGLRARGHPQGLARRHPRRRLHGVFLPVRVVGQRAARRRTRSCRSRTAPCACSSIRRASSTWTVRRWSTPRR